MWKSSKSNENVHKALDLSSQLSTFVINVKQICVYKMGDDLRTSPKDDV